MLFFVAANPYLLRKKAMKKRRIYAGEAHHVYQRTKDRGLIFYSVNDYLVFFTIVCTQARLREIEILSLCPMPDHIHLVLVVRSKAQLAVFVQTYAHLFATEWNRRRKKKGHFFSHPFDSAAKLGSKQVRTTLAYSNNNPVERKITERCEQYRWTFLPYYKNKSPYSLPINLSRANSRMRSILKEIDTRYQEGRYLNYAQLERWEKRLSSQEWMQVTDYIIGRWNIIDYEQAVSYSGDFETMIRSFHDNTGSEYEIKEDRDKYSDAVYADCSRIALSEGLVHRLEAIPALPDSQKERIYELLLQRTSARPRQIRKYLWLTTERHR